jgi:hypothetical protein
MRLFWLVLALVAAAAHAQAGEHDDEFRALDLNGDGAVSLAEAAGNAEVVTRFDRSDRNRDGKLSRAEFERLKKLKTRVTAVRPREPSAAAGSSRPR